MSHQEPGHSTRRTWIQWLHWVATEDHCEWANRFVYWLKTPLGVLGSGAIASLACGLWVAPQGYAVFGAIVAVVAIGLAWPWLGIRGLDCQLQFPTDRAREGRPTGVDVTITNRWPWPVWGLAIEGGFFTGGEAAVALARIGGWSKATFHWEFTPERRGVYPTAAPWLVTEFPFGLWKARRVIEVADQLTVWPGAFWLPPYPLASGSQDWTGHPSDSHSGHEGERIGLREHRPGDSLRMVHWAKSAAVDRLVVIEREGASHCSAVVDVDVAPESHASAGASDGSLEWTIRIAASVCETLLAQRVGVELRLGDRVCSFHPNQRDHVLLMDVLAMFDTQTPVNGHRAVPGRDGSRIALWIGTDRSKPRAGQGIVLTRGGFGGSTPVAETPAAGWVVVDSPKRVADQVLRGWRAVTQEAHRVA